MRVGIVGCGQIADAHLQELAKMREVQVVGLCDREILMARQASERFAVGRCFASLREMVQGVKPHVVHITTPPQSHLPLGLEALRAGCHIYVEKPLALSTAEADELLGEAERRDLGVCVGHIYQFDPPALELRALVEGGALGDVVHVESVYGYNLQGPYGQAVMANRDHWVHQLPGRLFQNVISHGLAVILDLLPDPQPEVIARAWIRRPERHGDIRDRVHDELRVMLQGQDSSGTLIFSSHARPALQRATVYGTKRTVMLDWQSRTISSPREATLPGPFGRLAQPLGTVHDLVGAMGRNVSRFLRADYQFFAGLQTLLQRFYASLLNDGPPPISPMEARRMTLVMDEIWRQIEEVNHGD